MQKIQERKEKKMAVNNSRTRTEKVKAQGNYTKANKLAKKGIRADKRKYMEDLEMEAEKAAREGNMKELYNTTKKLAGKYSKPERPVKDKEGRTIITGDEHQRTDGGSTLKIATMCMIVEQSIERNSCLYINFVDYEIFFLIA